MLRLSENEIAWKNYSNFSFYMSNKVDESFDKLLLHIATDKQVIFNSCMLILESLQCMDKRFLNLMLFFFFQVESLKISLGKLTNKKVDCFFLLNVCLAFFPSSFLQINDDFSLTNLFFQVPRQKKIAGFFHWLFCTTYHISTSDFEKPVKSQ
jgi:hypothetical protein